jgi:mannose-1-phosphate guanylyltransferase
MRALLLAGGLGTRLRPLTENIPKCLVPIKGRPLLDIWLERLTKVGINQFLINTHYLAQQVESYVQSSAYRDQIILVPEKSLRGTAGTLIENIDFFHGQDGLLIHADNYCLADLVAFQQAHFNRPKHCLMTMMTFRTSDPSSCGIVELDHNGIVTGFHEKVSNPPSNLANAAIYILSSELLLQIREDLYFAKDFSVEIVSRLLGKIYSYETAELLVDIGTNEQYKKVAL